MADDLLFELVEHVVDGGVHVAGDLLPADDAAS
jgi:hypothetical protein